MTGPQAQNPYPPGYPAPAQVDYLAGAAHVSVEGREPAPPLGYVTGAIKSIRRHQSTKPGGKPGILIHVDQIDGLDAREERAFRITFGGDFPHLAVAECKRLFAAIKGYAFADPRAQAADSPDMWPVFDTHAQHAGRRIGMLTSLAAKLNPKTGQPYVNTKVSTIGDVGEGAPPATIAAAPPAAPPPPAPAAAPIPAPVSGPPPGWYAFPPSDPRHATHYYNAQGEMRPIGSGA